MLFVVPLPLLVPGLQGKSHTRQAPWMGTAAIEVPVPVELAWEDQEVTSPASHVPNPALLTRMKRGPATPRQAGHLSCWLSAASAVPGRLSRHRMVAEDPG